MHHAKFSLVILAAIIAGSASAQLDIYNDTQAAAYNPALDRHTDHFVDFASWDAASRDSNLVSVSNKHPFDPPINIATATSRFQQPNFGDAILTSLSFVISDYSGIGSSQGYSASTEFRLRETLTVEMGGSTGSMIDMRVFVPVHGLLAARGTSTTHGIADASMDSKAYDEAGVLIDQNSGSLDIFGTDFNVFNTTVTGNWTGGIVQTTVDLPTGSIPRSYLGVELTSADVLDLGLIPTNSTKRFTIEYNMLTSASISSPSGLFAISDFTHTAGIQFKAFDGSGNSFTDFTVGPVPEPTSFAVLGLGVAVFVRRRRSSRR